ncbi:hypothetical protein T07_13306 [Trichinella nelsoni]|uniref:Uncharacterized protein n=1 Tax=Trichinella nelsoni TaxID=6336 RepID=A0A0V0SB86_9BILA|nr:hypothetical protein T07_13306 [Trichinella nelsoni]
MNEIAAFFGNYPLLNMWFFVITSINTSSQSTTTSYALGYASGKILKIWNFLKYSPRLYPQATPKGK